MHGFGDGPVGLVVDLPNEFLDEVLEGDDAVHPAVLVNHEGELFQSALKRRGASATRSVSGSR